MVELVPHPSRHPFDVADSDQSGASSCTVTVVICDVTACAAIDRKVSKEVLFYRVLLCLSVLDGYSHAKDEVSIVMQKETSASN